MAIAAPRSDALSSPGKRLWASVTEYVDFILDLRSTIPSRVLVAVAAGVLPADPIRAVGAVLAFPDRQALFDPIDEEAAGAECFAAMRSACRARHRRVTYGEVADAMGAGHACAVYLAFDLARDGGELL